MGGDGATLLAHSDPERIPPGTSHHEPVTSGELRVCGAWGTNRLQFVSVSAAYEGKSTLGHRKLLLVFRNSSGAFQLLTAARDPVSNGRFLQALASAPLFLAIDESSGERAIPARLLSPNPGEYPSPARGQRFGTFSWLSSPSDDVVAEVVEFAYKDDARLVLRTPPGRAMRQQVSAGELWTTRGEWTWRIWSIARSGEIALSDVRMFTH